jgi:hypothetical protein
MGPMASWRRPRKRQAARGAPGRLPKRCARNVWRIGPPGGARFHTFIGHDPQRSRLGSRGPLSGAYLPAGAPSMRRPVIDLIGMRTQCSAARPHARTGSPSMR